MLFVFLSTLAGCGGSGGGGGARTVTIGGAQPGGVGQENIATQVVYDLTGGRALPPRQPAPARVQIALTLRSADDRQHVVRIALPKPVKMTVPPGGAATRVIDGQEKGSYAISVDGGKPTAALVVG